MQHTPEKPDDRPLWLLAGAIVFYIPFQLHYDYLLNMFYHFGAPYNDAGILAQIVWRGDWKLTPPLIFTNYSFLGVHFTPLFMLLCQLSYFLPTHMVEFYSAFVAGSYACLGLALFCAFRDFIAPRGLWKITGLALLCMLFSFNAVIMDGIWIGHFEYAIPLGILLFCFYYVRRQWGPCILSLLFTLSVREDAGIHLIAVMGLIGLIRFYERRTWESIWPEAFIIVCTTIYTVIAIWLNLAARGYYGSTFQTIYSGQPSYAHLTFALLSERAGAMFKEHIYLWLGFLIMLVQAWRTRNPYLLVGYVAYLPWFLISWTANNSNPGYLRAYYAFPFIVSLGWPIIGVALKRGFPMPYAARREAVILQAALICIALIAWNDGDKRFEFGPDFGARYGSYRIRQSTENSQLLRDFMAKFDAGEGNLGIVMADDNAMSLVRGHYKGADMTRTEVQHPADTLLYMHASADPLNPETLDQVRRNQLGRHFCITGTSFCLFTNRGPEQLGTLGALLTETPLKN